VARFGARDVERLMNDAGIVRNRLKIESTIDNARAILTVSREHGSFNHYIWSFAPAARSQRTRPKQLRDIPSTSPESDALSKDLKRRGFRFVGSTIMYAFMQATGLVNDHTADCFRSRSPRRVVR
jgi:DNA-3-methyladenine glycosylase I